MVTTKTLFIYDTTGTIVHSSVFRDGMSVPVGLPSVLVDVPEGLIVKSIDPETQKPICEKSGQMASELDSLHAKIDYVAMMSDIDITRVCAYNKYERVREYYLVGLWSLKALRDAQIKGWITPKEYGDIVMEKENLGIDTGNEIPSVTI